MFDFHSVGGHLSYLFLSLLTGIPPGMMFAPGMPGLPPGIAPTSLASAMSGLDRERLQKLGLFSEAGGPGGAAERLSAERLHTERALTLQAAAAAGHTAHHTHTHLHLHQAEQAAAAQAAATAAAAAANPFMAQQLLQSMGEYLTPHITPPCLVLPLLHISPPHIIPPCPLSPSSSLPYHPDPHISPPCPSHPPLPSHITPILISPLPAPRTPPHMTLPHITPPSHPLTPG